MNSKKDVYKYTHKAYEGKESSEESDMYSNNKKIKNKKNQNI